MGQAESNVTSGVKKQAGVSTQKLYKLINLKGSGLLVDMMKRAINNKQFAEIDHAIKTKAKKKIFKETLNSNLHNFRRWSRFYTIRDVENTFPLPT